MSKFRDFKSGLIYCIMSGISLTELVFLIIFSSIYGNAYDIVSFTLFGTSLFLLYLFNTLYFWINNKTANNVLIRFIHIFIFLLIASTYTCICLGPLKGPWGWSIFGIIWGLSLIGIIFSSIWANIPKILLTAIYISLSLIILIAIYPLINIFYKNNMLYSLLYLLFGIIFYLIGSIFYNLKNKKIRFIYKILFIFGNLCHFLFIIKYLLFI